MSAQEMIDLRFHYGPETVSVAIPARSLCQIPPLKVAAPVADQAACFAAALARPIGSPPLRDLARGAKRVAVIVPDYTRDTPTALMLPPVLAEFEAAGVPGDGITIVGATGSHRPMLEQQLLAAVGEAVFQRLRVVSHDAQDGRNLVQVGLTPCRVPIRINRSVAEADVVVGIGTIKPHFNYGWSGGAKIVLPGVSGWETIGQAHWRNASYCDSTTIGTIGNHMRGEGEAVAEASGLRFILNAVANGKGQVSGAVAGDFRAAWYEGVRRAKAENEYDFEYFRDHPAARVDVIIAGTKGLNMFHGGGAGVVAADQMLRNGGSIVQFCPCSDGVAVEHPEVAEFGYLSYGETRELVAAGKITNLTGATLMVNLGEIITRRSAMMHLYAHNLSAQQIERLRLRPAGTPQAAVDAALAAAGPNARVLAVGQAD